MNGIEGYVHSVARMPRLGRVPHGGDAFEVASLSRMDTEHGFYDSESSWARQNYWNQAAKKNAHLRR
jgi:hypothetical protein